MSEVRREIPPEEPRIKRKSRMFEGEPPKHLGRPFSKKTPLGRVMSERHLRVSQVAGACNVPIRVMSEYLAGRVLIRGDHLARMSEYFNLDTDELQYQDEETCENYSQLIKKMGWNSGGRNKR